MALEDIEKLFSEALRWKQNSAMDSSFTTGFLPVLGLDSKKHLASAWCRDTVTAALFLSLPGHSDTVRLVRFMKEQW